MRVYLLSFLFILLFGCTKTIYVPVESTRTEYRDNFLRDSIYVQDSIYVYGKNDTIRIEKYRTIYKDHIRVDSIFVQDSIRVPYPVEKIVYRNKTSWYEDLLIYIGLGAVGILLLWLIKRRF